MSIFRRRSNSEHAVRVTYGRERQLQIVVQYKVATDELGYAALEESRGENRTRILRTSSR